MLRDAAVLAAAAFVGLTAGVSATSQQTQAPPPANGTAILTGQAIDDTTRQPLGGAVVTLSLVTAPARAGGPPGAVRRASAMTNADGRFVFRDVPAGTFTVTSALAGYSAGAAGQVRPAGPSRSVVIADGARITDVIVRMWRLSTVSGVVRDDLGNPQPGAVVWALRRYITSGWPELGLGSGVVDATDEQGRYRLSGLAPGVYVIGVIGWMQTNPAATVQRMLQARAAAPVGGSPGISVTVEGRESGAVQIERSGVEINGWQVTVSGGLQPLPGPDGTLLMYPQTYYPGVTEPADATPIALAPGVDRHGLDFTMPLVKGVRVSGVLMGPNGPATRNALRLLPQPSDTTAPVTLRPIAYGTADDEGRFVLLGVPPGRYVIDAYRAPLSAAQAQMFSSVSGEKIDAPASPAPAVHARVPISVGDTHVDGLTVTMMPRGSVSGRVVFTGSAPRPVDEQSQLISVELWNVQTTNRVGARMTPEGTFDIKDVPPGRYHVLGESLAREWRFAGVEAHAALASSVLTIHHDVITDMVVSFTDRTMALQGAVTDESGRLATDGSVVLFPADVKAWIAAGTAVQRTKVVPISADGSFQMSVDLPGEYLLVAAPADIHPQTTVNPITVDPYFALAYAPLGVKIAIALGDNKTQALTMRRVR